MLKHLPPCVPPLWVTLMCPSILGCWVDFISDDFATDAQILVGEGQVESCLTKIQKVVQDPGSVYI